MTLAPRRQPGRPPNVERRIRMLLRDEAEAAAVALVRQAKLGDPGAAEAVIRLALGTPLTVTHS